MLVTLPRLLRRTAEIGWFVFTIGIVPGQTWAFWDRTRPAYRNVASTTDPSLSGQFLVTRATIRRRVRLTARSDPSAGPVGPGCRRGPGAGGRAGRCPAGGCPRACGPGSSGVRP